MDVFDVLVIGEANVDLIVQSADPMPVYGREKLVDDLHLTIGSSSAIFACGVARLGLRTALASVVGADEFGDFMIRALQDRGVATELIRRLPGRKTGATVSLSAAHDRALLTYPGTIADLEPGMIDPDALRRARHVHTASYFLQPRLAPGLPELLARARAAGATVSLDTGWDPADRWDAGLWQVLEQADVFLPNEIEAQRITGTQGAEEALAALAERLPIVVIKQGAQGAMARRGREVVRVPAMPVQVVDTTGAGDSFDAGFVYGHLRGWGLRQCVAFAAACGALSTRALGGTGSQATLDEVQRALRSE
ncbi:MAG: carbohydrate kinase family protein [Anaerolineae bacterium]